jgi:hypothetical protein
VCSRWITAEISASATLRLHYALNGSRGCPCARKLHENTHTQQQREVQSLTCAAARKNSWIEAYKKAADCRSRGKNRCTVVRLYICSA